MTPKRYELSDAQWERIALLLPGKAGDPGRSGANNRLFVNGCLWILRSGAHWRDLPERYGKWSSSVKQTIQWIVCSAEPFIAGSAAGVMPGSGSGCSRR